MGRRIDPSWGGPIELFLVRASAPHTLTHTHTSASHPSSKRTMGGLHTLRSHRFALSLSLFLCDLSENIGCLLSAHHRNPGIRPHVHEPWTANKQNSNKQTHTRNFLFIKIFFSLIKPLEHIDLVFISYWKKVNFVLFKDTIKTCIYLILTPNSRPIELFLVPASAPRLV